MKKPSRKPAKSTRRAPPTARKKAPSKRGSAAPATAAVRAAVAEWIVGPYGDIVSKKDLEPLAASRTPVS